MRQGPPKRDSPGQGGSKQRSSRPGGPRRGHRSQGSPGGNEPKGSEPRQSKPKPRPQKLGPPKPGAFHSFDEIRAVLEQVLEASVADETEIVWLERRAGRASSHDHDPGSTENPRLTVLVRAVEAGRQGWYRTDTADVHLLESGVRQALAMAKVRQRLKQRPILPEHDDELQAPRELLDPEISRLTPESAGARLRRLCGEKEGARLSWTDTRLVIFNSHGLRRSAASTEVTLHVRSGSGPQAGRAAASARRLAQLEEEVVRARARAGVGSGAPDALPQGPVPVLLAPEATVQWLNVLNAFAFSGHSYLDGTSFLAKHRNVQVFDRQFNLRDDGTAPGLPFPFDFEGSRKHPLDLIVKGRPTTPALNQVQSAQAGLEPTAQAVGGQDAFFSNLFLLAGESAGDDLRAAADGGLEIGWLEPPECFEPTQLKVRMIARGVRRITHGRPGAVLPDLVWQESLLGALARLRGVGRESVVLATATTPLGGISAPAIVLEASEGFQPISRSDGCTDF